MKAAEDAVLALGAAASAGCVIGRHLGLSPRGFPLVSFGGCSAGLEARTVCTEFAASGGVGVGCELLLQFESGDPARPVVIGLIQPPVVAVRVDDAAVLSLKADRRIELVCGKASIVLTAEGKVVVKGANLISRSTGPNKIRGASVDIN